MTRCCTFCGAKTGNYRFPKDEELKRKWRAAIPRQDIPTHRDTVICAKHWPENAEKVCVNGKLRPRDDDPPSIFDVPKSMLPTPSPAPRGTKRSSAGTRNFHPDELSSWLDMDNIPDLERMKAEIPNKAKELGTPLFVHAHLPDQIIVQSIDFAEGTGVPRFLLKISSDQSFQAFHFGVRCSIPSLVRNRTTKLTHWSELEEIVRFDNRAVHS